MDTVGSASNALREGPFDVLVVGAGFAGLYAVHNFTRLGLNVIALEAGGDVGGTWYWNRYPGARCDVESLEYSYSFSPEIQQDWNWSHKYATQGEILSYLNYVADRLQLRDRFRFNTRVVAQTFDEEKCWWEVRTEAGELLIARSCVMATGNLSMPRLPDIPGIDRFRGRRYHSALWPSEGVDFAGQRVGLIGTGSTGIQIAPQVAEQANHLFVFQRSPNFSVPARNATLDPQFVQDFKKTYPDRRRRARKTGFGISNVPPPTQAALDVAPEQRRAIYEALWAQGGSVGFLSAFTDLLTDPAANETAAEFVRGKIREIVKDQETAKSLCPTDHPIGAKRLCVDTGYYQTFNRANVTLVDVRKTPIDRITEGGIRTSADDYALDSIVFATGFDAMTGALREIDIRGRGGALLADKWARGPITYLGLMVDGFPNLFIVTGPGSPSVKSNMVCSIEQHVELITSCLRSMGDRGAATLEPTAAAAQAWTAHVDEVAQSTLYPRANSWYSGSNVPGKSRVFMPYVAGLATYIAACEDVVADGYRGFVFDGPGTAKLADQDDIGTRVTTPRKAISSQRWIHHAGGRPSSSHNGPR